MPRYRTSSAAPLKDAPLTVKEQGCDIVVMVVESLSPTVTDVIGTLAGASEKAAVIVVLDELNQATVQAALHLGVRGCISSMADPSILVDTIDSAFQGGFTIGRSVVEALAWEERMIGCNLGETEIRFLRLVGEGLDNSQLAAQLCVSDSTLRRISCRVVTKLGVANRTQAAVQAARQGLI